MSALRACKVREDRHIKRAVVLRQKEIGGGEFRGVRMRFRMALRPFSFHLPYNLPHASEVRGIVYHIIEYKEISVG